MYYKVFLKIFKRFIQELSFVSEGKRKRAFTILLQRYLGFPEEDWKNLSALVESAL